MGKASSMGRSNKQENKGKSGGFPLNEACRELKQKFGALESTLSLHYASHSTDPHMSDLLQRSSLLIEKRISVGDLEQMLGIYPGVYHVYEGSGGKEWTNVRYPRDMTIAEYNHKIPLRKENFTSLLEEWSRSNPSSSQIPAPPLTISRDLKKNGHRVSKLATPTKKINVLEMKNKPEKFRFKQRNEEEEKEKSEGLSLLERIKRKEKLNKLEGEETTPEQKYEAFLSGKLVHFYNILYQTYKLEKNQDRSKTYSVKSLSQTISDSLSHPLSESDIINVLKLLSRKLSSRIEITKYNETDLLKVKSLDRNEDIPLLK